mgnify:CR=1 FL=1
MDISFNLREKVARRLLEDNVLDKMKLSEDQISQLQKLYSRNTIPPATTAENDFQVGTEGHWRTMTLAEVLVILDLPAANIPISGWVEVSDTWTYASASTITVPTDATLLYQKGDFLRFKQGAGYKYAVISAVAATLVTIIVNTDYVVANSAISDIAYSRSLEPFGWPDWFNYTPTITASIGTFTTVSATGRYKISHLKIDVVNVVTITTNGTAAGTVIITAPVNIAGVTAWGAGRETAVTGAMLGTSKQSATAIGVRDYAFAYPGASGRVLNFGTSYEW